MKFHILLCTTMMFSVIATADDTASDLDAVNTVIDNFHTAAAQGDKARYLGLANRALCLVIPDSQ